MFATSLLWIYAHSTADRVATRGVRRAYFQLATLTSLERSLSKYDGLTLDMSVAKIGAARVLRGTYSKEISRRIP